MKDYPRCTQLYFEQCGEKYLKKRVPGCQCGGRELILSNYESQAQETAGMEKTPIQRGAVLREEISTHRWAGITQTSPRPRRKIYAGFIGESDRRENVLLHLTYAR